MAEKFLHETVRQRFVGNLKAFPREVAATLRSKLVQGAYELGAALFHQGDAYRGDLGLLTAQATPEPAPEVGRDPLDQARDSAPSAEPDRGPSR